MRIGRQGGGKLRQAGLVLGVTAVNVLITSHNRAIGAARNDDWAALQTAFEYFRHSRFVLGGWMQMALVGQSLAAWPAFLVFGDSISTAQFVTLFFSLVAALSIVWCVRSFASGATTTVALALFVLSPMYGPLSLSFMTDITSFALQAASLACLVRYVSAPQQRTRWLVGAVALGCASVTIREFGVVCIGLALGVSWWSPARRPATVVRWLMLLASIGFTLGFLRWRSGLPNTIPVALELAPKSVAVALRACARAVVTGVLLLLPVFATPTGRSLIGEFRATVRTKAKRAAVVGTGLALAAVLWDPLGNYVTGRVPYAEATRDLTATAVPRPLFILAWIGACVATVAVLGYCAEALRSGTTPTGLTARSIAGYAIEQLRAPSAGRKVVTPRQLVAAYVSVSLMLSFLATIVLNAPLFDRYLVGLVPLTGALLLTCQVPERAQRQPARRSVHGAVAFATLAAVSIRMTDASSVVDGGKWSLAQSAVQRGYDPTSIDAGFEWFSFHQPGPVLRPMRNGSTAFWINLFPARQVCVVIAPQNSKVISQPGTTFQRKGVTGFSVTFVEHTPSPADTTGACGGSSNPR